MTTIQARLEKLESALKPVNDSLIIYETDSDHPGMVNYLDTWIPEDELWSLPEVAAMPQDDGKIHFIHIDRGGCEPDDDSGGDVY